MSSSQQLKQLKIKTSTVKRLKKQYTSYQKQTKSIKARLEHLSPCPKQQQEQATQSHGQAQGLPQDIQLQIKKQNQFLTQSETVLSNVKQKLIQSFEGLVQFLSEKDGQQWIQGTEEKKNAEEVVLDVETFLENIGNQ